MTSAAKNNILGFHFDALSYEEAFQSILKWYQAGQSRLISLVNPYSVLLGHWDAEMGKAIKSSSLVLADGVGIVHASRLLGYEASTRVTGPALMLKVCNWSRLTNMRHYFYGGSPTVIEDLVNNLKDQFDGLKVAGYESPPFRPLTEWEDAEAIARINDSGADIVWIGLGAPKQEKWMLEHLGQINATALIGVGAAFDFHAGSIPWAPDWMRTCGIEWAYRLYQEPRRMWRRNLASFLFLSKVLVQSIKRRLFRRPDGTPIPDPPYYCCQQQSSAAETSTPIFSA